ncbi:MAG: hypothetical protein AAB336_11830 [Acidobacteriota bacterium]
MKAEEFITKLATLTPAIEVERYDDAEDYGDELVNLAMNYDISDVDFGDIGFADEVLGDDDYYEVGMFEEKYLVIDRQSGEVRVEADDEEGTIVYSCAETSEKFLDALWVAVRYFSVQLNEKLKDTDLESRELKAQQCAEVAGSEDYFPFYQDFLNCYER